MITMQDVVDAGTVAAPVVGYIAVGAFLQKFLGIADFVFKLFKPNPTNVLLNDLIKLVNDLNTKVNGGTDAQAPVGQSVKP